jgi:hypothetical protein
METLLNITVIVVFTTLFIAMMLGGTAILWLSIDLFKDFYRERRN